jgi:hypothetical protein
VDREILPPAAGFRIAGGSLRLLARDAVSEVDISVSVLQFLLQLE